MVKRGARGITLVEVVVAMTVVVIVSFAALSTVLSAAESFENQRFRQYAVNEADVVLAALQAENPAAALAFAYDTEFSGDVSGDGMRRLAVYIPADYYRGAGGAAIRIDTVSGINAEADTETYDSGVECAVKVVAYIKNGVVDYLSAESRYIGGGLPKLRRAYFLTSPVTLPRTAEAEGRA